MVTFQNGIDEILPVVIHIAHFPDVETAAEEIGYFQTKGIFHMHPGKGLMKELGIAYNSRH